jgi:hypothetical protein
MQIGQIAATIDGKEYWVCTTLTGGVKLSTDPADAALVRKSHFDKLIAVIDVKWFDQLEFHPLGSI